MTRHVALIVIDRANWGRLQPVAEAIQAHPALRLSVVCGGSTVLPRFGCPADAIEQAGYTVTRLYHEVEGNTPATMAMSGGYAQAAYAAELARLRPDVVIVIGDRYEAHGAATAAFLGGFTLVHLQGGEVSGCVDDALRHAITKMAHYHVPATEQARQRILQMGEPRESILTVGCPSSDLAAGVTPREGGRLLVVYHPDTLDYAGNERVMDAILEALGGMSRKWPTDLLWPNIDAGSDAISKAIRRFGPRPWLHTVKNLPPAEYLQKLADAACCVGNSSSFVRDAGFFGTPVVLVGQRQSIRECGWNVRTPGAAGIAKAVEYQIRHGRYPGRTLYGDGHVSERIAEGLAGLALLPRWEFVRWSRPKGVVRVNGASAGLREIAKCNADSS